MNGDDTITLDEFVELNERWVIDIALLFPVFPVKISPNA